MIKYIALLRGINVGGNNLIKMSDLKACFESQGFTNVTTYIQSGNVIFESDISDQANLTDKIEQALSKQFNYGSRVVIKSDKQIKDIIAKAPKSFGDDPAKYRYDVLFLKGPLTADQAIKIVPTKEGVDKADAGPGVIYFSRLIEKASQSKLNRIVGQPIYQQMTIRNWNTTTRLLNLTSPQSD